MKYYKNKEDKLYYEPSEKVIKDHELEKITKKQFDKILEIQNTPSEEELKQARIAELKTLLKESDYKVLPDYDKKDDDSEGKDIVSQRQAWRDEIRSLEA